MPSRWPAAHVNQTEESTLLLRPLKYLGAISRFLDGYRNLPWPAATDRLDFLDGLRGLAALFIVCHHSYSLVELCGGALPRSVVFLRFGHFVVTLFIILSGYCLAMPLLKGGALRGGTLGFLKRRAIRILPPYYAAVGISLVISLLAGGGWIPMTGFIPVTAAGVASHLLLVNNIWGNTSHTVFGDPTLSGVFWSTAVEWQISLLFPVLAWLWRRFHPLAVAPVIGLLAYGVERAGAGTVWAGLSAPYYLMFAVGMLAATVVYAPWCARLRERAPWSFLCGVSFTGFCAVSVQQGYNNLSTMFGIADLLFAPFAFTLLIAASRFGELQRALSWKPITALGAFSYSIYLLHEPLLKVLFGAFFEHHVGTLGAAAALALTLVTLVPLTILASRLFYEWFEKPVIRQPSKAATVPMQVPQVRIKRLSPRRALLRLNYELHKAAL